MDPANLQPDGLPDFESRRVNTEAWFEEWNFVRRMDPRSAKAEGAGRGPGEDVPDSLMMGEDGNPSVPSPGPRRFRRHSYDVSPEGFEPGCVRLPGPELAGCEEAPYFLVLGPWIPGWLLVAPFSGFEAPASVWEILTGSGPRPLRVLQAWNVRSLPEALAAQSWFVGRLPTTLAEDTRTLFRASATGETEILGRLGARLGVGIVRLDDPRIRYFEEEAARFSSLDRLVGDWEEWKAETEEASNQSGERDDETAPPAKVIPFALPQPLALAAATGEDTLLPSAAVEAGFVEILEALAGPPDGTRASLAGAKQSDFQCRVEAAIRPVGEDSSRWLGIFSPMAPPRTFPEGCPFLLLRRNAGDRPRLVGSGRTLGRRFHLREGTPGLENVPFAELALLVPSADLP